MCVAVGLYPIRKLYTHKKLLFAETKSLLLMSHFEAVRYLGRYETCVYLLIIDVGLFKTAVFIRLHSTQFNVCYNLPCGGLSG